MKLGWLARVTVAWLAQHASASACEAPPSCGEPGIFLPRAAERELPANAFYFEVLVADPGPLALRDVSSGAAIAASIKTIGADRVYAPDVSLTVGQQVELEFTQGSCGTQKLSYTAAAPIALPLMPAPAVALGERGYLPPLGELRRRFAHIEYERGNVPSNLLRRSVEVDGELWFEDFWPNAIPTAANCDGSITRDTCGQIRTLSPGRHTVEVTSHVLGGASVTQQLEVDLTCADQEGDDAAASALAQADGGNVVERADGCSLGTSSGGGGLLAALALLLRRKTARS